MSAERKSEDADKESMMKSMNDSYTRENEKNSCNDIKKTPAVDVWKGKSIWGRRRVWLVATVLVLIVLACIGAGVGIASAPYVLHGEYLPLRVLGILVMSLLSFVESRDL